MKRFLPLILLFFAPVFAFSQTGDALAHLAKEYSLYWPMLILFLCLGAAIATLALFMSKQHPPAHPNAEKLAAAYPQYQKLRGWLLIPMLALILKAIGGILSCIIYGLVVLDLRFWQSLMREYETGQVLYMEAMAFGFAIQAIWPAFFLPVLLVQFFRRKTIVPCMVVVHVLTTLFLFLGMMPIFLLGNLGSDANNFAYLMGRFSAMCLMSLPWIAYFTKSKRVHVFFCR